MHKRASSAAPLSPAARPAVASSAFSWSDLPPGSTVVVDTAPFIYVLQGHAEFAPRFVGLFEAEADGALQIALSTITLAEVLTGPLKAGQDALARRYEKAMSQFEVVAVSPAVAVQAARMRARYALKLPDALQLATALEVGAAALVTHDRDFSLVEGLTIVYGADV